MKSTGLIKISNPSKELVAFMEEVQRQKKERMEKICEKYRRLIKG